MTSHEVGIGQRNREAEDRTADPTSTDDLLRAEIARRERVEKQLRRVNRAHLALCRCNQALIGAREESALLQEVCRIVVEAAEYRLCWVGYAEQDEAQTVRL